MQPLDDIIEAVRRRGARTVGLQYPEGLRGRALEIARALEQATGAQVMISTSPSFGACDVPRMPVDLVVHLGHAPMPYLNLRDVEFLEYPQPLASLEFLEAALPLLGRRVGLLTTAQHLGQLEQVAEYLRARGFEVATGGPDGRVAYAGQLLGCDMCAVRNVDDGVDCFLYVGTGDFHPLGAAMVTSKTVVVADPFTGEVRTMSALKDRVLRQRFGAIARAKEARKFGIIASKKIGQYRMNVARELKAKIEAAGREATIFLMDYVDPMFLKGYDVDALVNTACPRITVDDYLRYDRPMLTPQELEVVLGLRSWDDWVFDEITSSNEVPPLRLQIG
jgi:2-(3-amino-3-carboxypropyl)histidine synthase